MRAVIEYLLYVDVAGLALAALLVWQSSRLDKRMRAWSKPAGVHDQRKKQVSDEVSRINPSR